MNLKRVSESLSQTYSRMKFFTTKSLFKMETAKFMYLCKEQKLPKEFNDYIEPINHGHLTRSAAQLNYKPSQPRRDLGKSSVKYQSVLVWNNLPVHVKNEKNKKKFVENLKTYLLSQQEL